MIFEIIIGVVLVAVASVAVYTVVQNKKTDQQAIAEPAPKEEVKTPKYLDIKEIGLKLPILAGLEDITYKSYPEESQLGESGKLFSSTTVNFSSKSIVEAAKGTEYTPGEPATCENGAIGAITKYSIDPKSLNQPYSVEQKTVGGKYYDLSFADGGYCSSDEKAVEIIKKQMELLKKSFASAEAL